MELERYLSYLTAGERETNHFTHHLRSPTGHGRLSGPYKTYEPASSNDKQRWSERILLGRLLQGRYCPCGATKSVWYLPRRDSSRASNIPPLPPHFLLLRFQKSLKEDPQDWEGLLSSFKVGSRLVRSWLLETCTIGGSTRSRLSTFFWLPQIHRPWNGENWINNPVWRSSNCHAILNYKSLHSSIVAFDTIFQNAWLRRKH